MPDEAISRQDGITKLGQEIASLFSKLIGGLEKFELCTRYACRKDMIGRL
jgi:hypothetical protein